MVGEAHCWVRRDVWEFALAGWGSGVRSRADLLVRGSVLKGKEERRSEGPKPPAVGVSERLLRWMRQLHVASGVSCDPLAPWR